MSQTSDPLTAPTVGERLEAIRDGRAVPADADRRVARRDRGSCSTAATSCCSARTTTSASPPTRTWSAAAVAATERWGAGAGASRLVSGNMAPHERARAAARRLQRHRDGAAVRLRLSRQHRRRSPRSPAAATSSSPTSSTTRASSTAAGSPAPRRSSTATATSSTSPGASAQAARATAALIVTDGLFSMDGDVAQLGWLRELASRHGAMLMVDDAHAVGALGPGGRGSVAEAGLAGEVDVLIGTLGKALGSYGAYACVSREVRDLLVNTARPLIFSTGAAARRGRRGRRPRSRSSSPTRPGSDGCASNASTLRAALAANGLDPGGAGAQIMPGRGRRPRPRRRDLPACPRRRRLRAGDPAADRPRRAPRGCGSRVIADHEPDELVAAAGMIAGAFRAVSAAGDWSIDLPDPEPGEVASSGTAGASMRSRTATALPTLPRRRRPGPAEGAAVTPPASSSPAPGPRSARPSSPRSSRADAAAAGARRAPCSSPRSRASTRAASPTTPCSPARRGSAQTEDEIAPYRYGPPVSPAPRGRAGRRGDRRRRAARARGGGRRPTAPT